MASVLHTLQMSGDLSIYCFVYMHEIAVTLRHSSEVGFDLSWNCQKEERWKETVIENIFFYNKYLFAVLSRPRGVYAEGQPNVKRPVSQIHGTGGWGFQGKQHPNPQMSIAVKHKVWIQLLSEEKCVWFVFQFSFFTLEQKQGKKACSKRAPGFVAT